jgi:hypothetical protein
MAVESAFSRCLVYCIALHQSVGWTNTYLQYLQSTLVMNNHIKGTLMDIQNKFLSIIIIIIRDLQESWLERILLCVIFHSIPRTCVSILTHSSSQRSLEVMLEEEETTADTTRSMAKPSASG